MSETWTVKRCLDWTNEYLGGKGIEKPRVSAEWMLSSILGLSRTQLYMSFDRPLLPEELDRMHRSVVRRAKGEPLQYITGDTQFRIIDVACEPGVLIPRPETEMLVAPRAGRAALERRGRGGPPRGGGCCCREGATGCCRVRR